VTVAVTGGSGVVGGAVVRHLVAAGLVPRALSRTPASDEVFARLGAEPVRGDVLDRRSLAAAFAGVDTVFHLAGRNEMCPADPEGLERVNVGGTVNVVEAAIDAGVRRLVHTSSAASLGERRGTVGAETSPHRGSYLSAYERSKHLSELEVLARSHRLEVVVVNPSSVQGPGRATGTGALILSAARGRLPVLVDTRLSLVDIDDCARGHLLAAERGRPGERYVLNSFTIPVREALGLLAAELGVPVRVPLLPPALVGWPVVALAAAAERAFRLTGRDAPVCPAMVRTFRHGHAYDGSKAARELGLEYTGPAALIRRLVAWYRAEGLV